MKHGWHDCYIIIIFYLISFSEGAQPKVQKTSNQISMKLKKASKPLSFSSSMTLDSFTNVAKSSHSKDKPLTSSLNPKIQPKAAQMLSHPQLKTEIVYKLVSTVPRNKSSSDLAQVVSEVNEIKAVLTSTTTQEPRSSFPLSGSTIEGREAAETFVSAQVPIFTPAPPHSSSDTATAAQVSSNMAEVIRPSNPFMHIQNGNSGIDMQQVQVVTPPHLVRQMLNTNSVQTVQVVTPMDPILQSMNVNGVSNNPAVPPTNHIIQSVNIGMGQQSHVTSQSPIFSMMSGSTNARNMYTQISAGVTLAPAMAAGQGLAVTPKSSRMYSGYPAPIGPFESAGTPGPTSKCFVFKFIYYMQ